VERATNEEAVPPTGTALGEESVMPFEREHHLAVAVEPVRASTMNVPMGITESSWSASRTRPSLRGHLEIARVDHWVKNVFVLPGAAVALATTPSNLGPGTIAVRLAIGLLATGLIASSNYTINEVLDAPYDRTHPKKQWRAVPAGRVNVPLAYVQWIGLMVAGLGLALTISVPLAATLAALWVMGCVYNIPPVRSKELPYLDVLSEAVNNPLRMLAGWFIVTDLALPPISLLLSYWMVGCYFMAIKRYAELRFIADRTAAASYRKSFRWYTPERLLVSITFYGSAAMLFFGAFIMRYRLELILAFPLVALVMALYLALAFEDEGAAQAPEKLYRQPALMVTVSACAALMGLLVFVDVPPIERMFAPAYPSQVQGSPGTTAHAR
jgi:decaprenyl-phosphate phosphoribosyltransferase